MKTDAQRYYDTLKKIARGYQTVEQLKCSAFGVGLSHEEHIEMTYENLQWEANNAIKGKRRPE